MLALECLDTKSLFLIVLGLRICLVFQLWDQSLIHFCVSSFILSLGLGTINESRERRDIIYWLQVIVDHSSNVLMHECMDVFAI